jgi:hypothetical protein
VKACEHLLLLRESERTVILMVEPTDSSPQQGSRSRARDSTYFRAVKHAPFTMSSSSITPDLVSVHALVSEAERYLATVDYFRSQGCEPRWSGERTHAQTTLVDTEPNTRSPSATSTK